MGNSLTCWISTASHVGRSYRGYTAFAVSGAQLAPGWFTEQCAGLDPEDPSQFLCMPFVGNEPLMAEAAGLDEVPRGKWPSQADERVRAIVPIAGDAFSFGKAGLASVTIPTLAIGGTADTAAPWQWGTLLTYDHIASEYAAVVGLRGGQHMLPVTPCLFTGRDRRAFSLGFHLLGPRRTFTSSSVPMPGASPRLVRARKTASVAVAFSTPFSVASNELSRIANAHLALRPKR